MKRLLFSVLVVLGFSVIHAAAAEDVPLWGDTNGDGKLSKQEYCEAKEKSAKKAGKRLPAGETEKIFKNKDINGDGFLSREEVLTGNVVTLG